MGCFSKCCRKIGSGFLPVLVTALLLILAMLMVFVIAGIIPVPAREIEFVGARNNTTIYPAGQNLTFQTFTSEGDAVTPSIGTGDFIINETGTYVLSFSGTSQLTATPTVPQIAVQMFVDNVDFLESMTVQDFGNGTSFSNIGFEIVLNLQAGQVISLRNIAVDELYLINTNFNIYKIA